ncbi:MAG: OmpH family outer membrane protein, partial [Phycisphaerae bacterium]|nr:OmpH family outer membrane protein [Phycisphaerae bacterium]
MRKLSSLLAAALLAALTVPAAAQTTPRIAIANTARILNDLQETKDLNQKIANDLKALEAERAAKQQKVNDLQAQRDQLKTDAPMWADKNKEWLQARIDFEIWAQMQQLNLQNQQKIQMRALFNKITQAVAEVAVQKNIDVVFAEQRVEIPDNLDQINPEQLKAIIGQRNILFANSTTVDIT